MARVKTFAPPRPVDDFHLEIKVLELVEKLFPDKTFLLSVGRTGVDYARLTERVTSTKNRIHINITYGEPTALARLYNLLNDVVNYQQVDAEKDTIEVLKELQEQPPMDKEQSAAEFRKKDA
ncbi:hypothetical protein GTA08_BOTSDO08425 [Botryosphaeria dothidea]|uniref:Uncharacterized protein n=1 Tax=Botryosphaeria dothidea TaxID=55169 RepID=A0A8H4IMG5_9PEZI|nr:hypothetical protein GTA08_BOTSDO08425 [Botryosphaeria dothidea]